MKILILGAGPTGLGAAWKLQQLGHDAWELWEAEAEPGGLARSIVDEHGFTWDLGGHVQFSHYATFDAVMDAALGPDGWLEHERRSWVRILGTWVPYPFQNNIHRLPPEARARCLSGLLARRGGGRGPWPHFEALVRECFGDGIAELFMLPYNFKVWAYPPSELDAGWVGDRVAMPDPRALAESIVFGRDQLSWGPNRTFRFPRRGGTGAVWRAVAARLPADRLHFRRAAERIDPRARRVWDAQGRPSDYDALISTLPLDRLVELAGLDELRGAAAALKYSTVHVLGIGLEGRPAEPVASMGWMYFPEADCPFYRVTVFSNYSPHNVPDPSRYWSLMAEVSQSPCKPVDEATLEEATIRGLLATGLIEDRRCIHHLWRRRIERGYPTPSLGRDAALQVLLPALEARGIFSRGRFGAWKYEVSNQDHAFMQGVELAGRLVAGTPELTVWFPNLVNAPHPVYGKAWL